MNGARGFSLIELAVVLAVAAVLLGVAAPNLADLVRVQRLKAATSDLAEAIAFTRAQALARGRRVELVPRDAAGADWRSGWRVFEDRNDNGQPDAGELIAEHGPLAHGLAVDFAFTSSAPPRYIAYNGAGRSCADDNDAAARFGTLSLFAGSHVRRIKINMLGRPRVCDPARDDGCDGAAAPP